MGPATSNYSDNFRCDAKPVLQSLRFRTCAAEPVLQSLCSRACVAEPVAEHPQTPCKSNCTRSRLFIPTCRLLCTYNIG